MSSNSSPEYNRAWREKNPERYETNARKSKRIYKIRHRDKVNIHARVRRALRKGKIVKSIYCQLCLNGDLRIEGHHPDYDKPLEVIWICHACHRGVHCKGKKLTP